MSEPLFVYATSFRQVVSSPSALQRMRQVARSVALSMRSIVSLPSGSPCLRVLYCHYVFTDQRRAFEKLILYLLSIGDLLGADQVVDILTGKTSLRRHAFHMSFDDGFKNVFTNALPILREHGASATVFVPTAIISAPSNIVENYCRVTTNYSSVIEIASWDDLDKASANGFVIGSHTRNHSRFSEMSASKAKTEDEIYGSKEDIERYLGRACEYISWPYGRTKDADTRSLRVVEYAGYRACFGAFRGRIVPCVTNRFAIPRHHFEVQWPLSHIKCFVNGAMES
jgi:peptidoglycan/xylan/chitin deacetylase (PgdA/CDA1 family)